jgi:hypothetical protein
MKEYLFHPAFWISIIIVAIAVNWVWGKFFGGKGKLV